MSKRRTLRPALEALEARNLMAADLPVLYRSADNQRLMGPPVLGKSALEYTAPSVAEWVNPDPDFKVPPAGSVIGGVDGNYSNMTVEVVDGVLRIRGDAWKNHFRMFGGNGSYRIEPSLTKVNGQIWTYETGPFHFTGVTNGIEIDLGGGDDEFTLEIADAPSITIRTGAGNDKVALRGPDNSQWRSPDYGPGLVVWMALLPVPVEAIPLAINGDVFIDTGDGNDWISGYAHATGDVTVRMGDGDDNFVEGPLEREYWRPRTSRSITGDGVRTIDLGAGQDVEHIPDEIGYDFELYNKMSWLHPFFEHYRWMVERGENTPGVPQLVRYMPYDNPVRVDGEGRVEVEILFSAGLGRVVERLIARGVTIDAYTVLGGGARAVIHEQDLRLFANLPGLIRIQPVTYVRDEPRPVSFRWELPWDYIRPGSVPAEEELRWGPRSPVTNPPVPPVSPPSEEPLRVITPFIGPLPIELKPQRDENDTSAPSLKDSFYGRQHLLITWIVGPHLLQ